MKRNSKIAALAGFTAVAISFSAYAAKPVDDSGVPFGTGYPSGAHFNLNLLAKDANFTCPDAQYDESGDQVYGNVIFIPRVQGDDEITILMESGAKGPKGAQDTTELEVTDWCTESFPDYGSTQGDGASLRLPANSSGYAVYARVTGKPSQDGSVSASLSTQLAYVEDESGNDLILLGLVDKSGVATFASDGETLTRTSSDSKGKGAQKATNISGLFQWSGEVCYLQDDTDAYCLDGEVNLCSTWDLCCVPGDVDGVYQSCTPAVDSACETDTILLSASCRTYEEEWVFDIADFVGLLATIDNNGAYNIKLRFYPM